MPLLTVSPSRPCIITKASLSLSSDITSFIYALIYEISLSYSVSDVVVITSVYLFSI